MKFSMIFLLVTVTNPGHAAPALSNNVNEDNNVADHPIPVDPWINHIITTLFISSTALVIFSWVSFLIPPTKTEARLLVLLISLSAEAGTPTLSRILTIFNRAFTNSSASDRIKIMEVRYLLHGGNKPYFPSNNLYSSKSIP